MPDGHVHMTTWQEPPSMSKESARDSAYLATLKESFPELNEDLLTAIAALDAGLPVERVDALAYSLEVPTGRVSEALSIPASTFNRRRQSGRLDRGESERAFRLAGLIRRAATVFGSVPSGVAWLKNPQFALGGATPLSFSVSELGAREVENILGRIEHGIPA